MITKHARHRQMDRRTNNMAIARGFILTHASRAKNDSTVFNGTKETTKRKTSADDETGVHFKIQPL